MDPEPRQDPLRDWAAGPGGGRRPLRDRGAPRTRRKLQTEEEDTRMGLPEARDGWGASSLFLGPPCRANSLTCEAAPANIPTPGPARPPSACPAGWRLRVPPRSRRPPDDRLPGVPKAELWAWSRRGLDELLCRVGGPRRCGVKGRVGPRVPPARRSPEALSAAHLPPLSLQGRGRRRAGCTHRHHYPPPPAPRPAFTKSSDLCTLSHYFFLEFNKVRIILISTGQMRKQKP